VKRHAASLTGRPKGKLTKRANLGTVASAWRVKDGKTTCEAPSYAWRCQQCLGHWPFSDSAMWVLARHRSGIRISMNAAANVTSTTGARRGKLWVGRAANGACS